MKPKSGQRWYKSKERLSKSKAYGCASAAKKMEINLQDDHSTSGYILCKGSLFEMHSSKMDVNGKNTIVPATT